MRLPRANLGTHCPYALITRLWCSLVLSCKKSFRHKITGARSPYPRDTFGGIVADEMGLGKTLTMLSAICGSLSQAYTYARTITTDPHDGAKRVIAAKSTLIIVPSACELFYDFVDEES
jgi:SWI/SNF-related matrix-associated actin-dependent regulator of chromatin subfamily A3